MANRKRQPHDPLFVTRLLLKREAADARRRTGQFNPPYDPYAVARAASVRVEKLPLKGIDGYIRVCGEERVVMLNDSLPPSRSRFTLAHELGHLAIMEAKRDSKPVRLERYRSGWVPDGATRDAAEERLCNAFAAELLMPESDIRDHWYWNKLSPQNLLAASSKFNVSLQALARRTHSVTRRPKYVACWNTDPFPIVNWQYGFAESEWRSTIEEILERAEDPATKQLPGARLDVLRLKKIGLVMIHTNVNLAPARDGIETRLANVQLRLML